MENITLSDIGTILGLSREKRQSLRNLPPLDVKSRSSRGLFERIYPQHYPGKLACKDPFAEKLGNREQMVDSAHRIYPLYCPKGRVHTAILPKNRHTRLNVIDSMPRNYTFPNKQVRSQKTFSQTTVDSWHRIYQQTTKRDILPRPLQNLCARIYPSK